MDGKRVGGEYQPGKQPLGKRAPPTDWSTVSPTDYQIDPDQPIATLVNMKPFKLAEDAKGHDTTVGTRLPKDYGRWIQKILEAQGAPYDVRADVIRDAIHLGLIILSIRYNISPEWKVEDVLAHLSNQAIESQRIQERTIAFLEQVVLLWNQGAKERALTLLNSFIGTVLELDRGGKEEHWRMSRYLECIRDSKSAQVVVAQCEYTQSLRTTVAEV